MSTDKNRQLPLPRSSPNEDLETISRRQFSLLFDPKYFEIRHEDYRDKGIDLTIEVKENDSYTNFRSAFQLKSTSSTHPNKDGSISFPVNISNIQYLLNFVMPAYYILYEANVGQFYIESVNTIYAQLISKYQDRILPEQFTINFLKILDTKTVEEVYQQTLSKGKLFSRISPNIAMEGANPKNTSGILIDFDNQVYSIEDNLRLIDKYGFDLLNDHRFDTIIEIEKRSHPREKATPVFNLVCGIAYYQKAKIFKAIEFLKQAEKEKEHFAPEVQSMLEYTFLNAKFLLGLISDASLNEGVMKIIASQEIGSFLQLEKIKKEYWQGEGKEHDKLQKFYNSTESVLKDDRYNQGAYAIAYAQILSAEYVLLINDALKNFITIAGRFKEYEKTKTYQQWEALEKEFLQRFDATITFAHQIKDLLGLINLSGEKIAWLYNKAALRYILENFNIESFTVTGPVNPEDRSKLTALLKKLDNQAEAYESIGHIENKIACLERKYEIQRFLELNEDASATAELISELIADNEFNGIKERLQNLINGKTSHERMADIFVERVKAISEIVMTDSEIGPYFKEPLDTESLAIVEKDIKWSLGPFMKFHFPKLEIIAT